MWRLYDPRPAHSLTPSAADLAAPAARAWGDDDGISGALGGAVVGEFEGAEMSEMAGAVLVAVIILAIFLFIGSPDVTDAVICYLMDTCASFVPVKP